MEWYYIVAIVLGSITLLLLALTYFCFWSAFYTANKRRPHGEEEVHLPDLSIYSGFKKQITEDILYVRKLPHQIFKVRSVDGLTLFAKYYQAYPDAPIEIMFHGYRGTAERDLSTGVKRAFACGHNALVVDQRASGKSQGHVISFGIMERYDCQTWANFVVEKFGKNVQIWLTGISMGAATVIMATELPLPKNVLGVLADCGYDSIEEVIKQAVRQIKLPPKLFYPFIRLGAKLFGGFDLHASNPINAIQNCTLPVIFFHGDRDSIVPCEMSKNLYSACTAKKSLTIVKEAEHGIAYLINPKLYLDKARAFFDEIENA